MRRLPNPASLTHDERMQQRAAQLWFECRQTEPEVLPDGSAIYTADKEGKFYLQIFEGKALRMCRPVSGYYRMALLSQNHIRFPYRKFWVPCVEVLMRDCFTQNYFANVPGNHVCIIL